MVAYKSAWGEERVYFYNEKQQLTALPASWTDVVAVDPVVTVAAGRAPFRASDLLELARLLHCLSVKDSNNV
jgi:Family of unknown function (DUF5372)